MPIFKDAVFAIVFDLQSADSRLSKVSSIALGLGVRVAVGNTVNREARMLALWSATTLLRR